MCVHNTLIHQREDAADVCCANILLSLSPCPQGRRVMRARGANGALRVSPGHRVSYQCFPLINMTSSPQCWICWNVLPSASLTQSYFRMKLKEAPIESRLQIIAAHNGCKYWLYCWYSGCWLHSSSQWAQLACDVIQGWAHLGSHHILDSIEVHLDRWLLPAHNDLDLDIFSILSWGHEVWGH